MAGPSLEKLECELAVSLLSSLDARVESFLKIFAKRHGAWERRRPFPRHRGDELRYSLRGSSYEGVIGFTQHMDPDRLDVVYEGCLEDGKEAVRGLSFLCLLPAKEPWTYALHLRPDGWWQVEERLWGLRRGEAGAWVVEDIEAVRESQRLHHSALMRDLLRQVDSRAFDRAVDLLLRHRASLPEEELIRLYRHVGEATGRRLPLPMDGSLKTLVDTMVESMRGWQGRAVVLKSDGSPA